METGGQAFFFCQVLHCIISFVDGLDFNSSDLAPGIHGEAEGSAIQGEAEERDIQAEGKADIDMKGEFLALVG